MQFRSLIILGVLILFSGAVSAQNAPGPQYYDNTAPARSMGESPKPEQQRNISADETASDDWPRYPYPRHRNPYYTGRTSRELLTGTLDELFSLPFALYHRVSGLMDRRIFSKRAGAPAVQTRTQAAAEPSPNPEPGLLDPRAR
jgi:hypothetical protein